MSTVIPSNFDVTVAFPDGSTAKINLFQMGMMARAVKFYADTGIWPQGVQKLKLTRKSICERFYIDPAYAKTWAQLAETLAECHESMMAEREAVIENLAELS